MKNIKNTAAAFGLMATLVFGAVSANAGILISDKNGAQPCGTVKSSLLDNLTGVVVSGLPMLDGIIIVGRAGIMMSDRTGIMMSDKGSANGGCSKDGILISDRDGILHSDRSGILISD